MSMKNLEGWFREQPLVVQLLIQELAATSNLNEFFFELGANYQCWVEMKHRQRRERDEETPSPSPTSNEPLLRPDGPPPS